MSRVEYDSLRGNSEVISKAIEEQPSYTDDWMGEVQELQ